FAISIGLERDGKLRSGVVFDAMRNEMFWAEEGQGAWLENKRLRVGARRKLTEAVVTTGIPQLGVNGGEKFLDELARVRTEVAAVRRFGSAALDLAWVAAGRFDGFWERGLSPWDIAAGFVLMQEAGGMVIGLDKSDPFKGSFVAANTSLAQKLSETIEGKIKKPAAPVSKLKKI
ncbi:MAG TPA: inositol monophosphatase family protein, partial [Hyphomonadaceae bacterium]|nr:inositol monophosphatase family protein [Hyphomonadaceae bacterium]